MKVHVHVYKVVGKAEIDLKSSSIKKAEQKALRAIKKVKNPKCIFGKSDYKYIAIGFDVSNDKTKHNNP